MFKLEIAFDPQSGKPFLVDDHPQASWLKLYPNHKMMLRNLLRQAKPKGYNEKHFMSALMVLCGDTPEPEPAPSDVQKLPPFEQAWARYEAKGYRYGGDALENVAFGYRIAAEELTGNDDAG